MKRAENYVMAKINHISFIDDSLVFEFAKGKGHQAGEDHVGPWHLYANPFEPHLCVVTALVKYLFTYPKLLKDNASLFQGTLQYNRYTRNFSEILKECKDDLEKLGVEDGDLGTHSTRKGVELWSVLDALYHHPLYPCVSVLVGQWVG